MLAIFTTYMETRLYTSMILMSPTVSALSACGIVSPQKRLSDIDDLLHVFSRRDAETERSHKLETTSKQSKTER